MTVILAEASMTVIPAEAGIQRGFGWTRFREDDE